MEAMEAMTWASSKRTRARCVLLHNGLCGRMHASLVTTAPLEHFS